jgi:hypothetical protein
MPVRCIPNGSSLPPDVVIEKLTWILLAYAGSPGISVSHATDKEGSRSEAYIFRDGESGENVRAERTLDHLKVDFGKVRAHALLAGIVDEHINSAVPAIGILG